LKTLLVFYQKKQLSHLDQYQKPISEHNKRFFITQFFASNEGHLDLLNSVRRENKTYI